MAAARAALWSGIAPEENAVTKSILLALALAGGLALPAAADCRFTLNFAHGSARITLADRQLLGDIARAWPEARVRLSAHADDDGTPAQNARVAQARAQAVAAQLVRKGMVVETLALSADWDVVPTRGWSSPLNRRVELLVSGCSPRAHLESRPLDSPGVAFSGRRVILTAPDLP